MLLSNVSRRGIAKMSLIFFCILAVGCGTGTLNLENYETITEGMSLSEVEAILGKGKEQASASSGGNLEVPGFSGSGISVPGQTINIPKTSFKSLVWEDGQRVISVVFQNDKVMSKAQVGL